MNTPIHNFLTEYAAKKTVRAHMPGGKGINSPLDITEIDGADVLYEADGIIRESERNAAKLFGADDTAFSCGGSTLAIQSMLAVIRRISAKNTILAGRYCHKSLIHSAILLGFNVKWLYPEHFLGTDLSPALVGREITSDTAAVFLNSIDYYGGTADIRAVSLVCNKNNVPLLVDNAHGAYRVFTGNHPITLGADMTADSAHKTLPALTGTAYLHLKDKSLLSEAKAAMSLFGSSSPSYLMLDSLDLCNKFIAEEKASALKTIEQIKSLKNELISAGIPIKESDEMRITINAAKIGYSGYELAEILRKSGIECEMSDRNYVVLLFSVVQPESDFEKIYNALKNTGIKSCSADTEIPVLRGETVISPRDAYFSMAKTVEVKKSVGMICADICCPCPPCVPLIMPGERITAEFSELLSMYGVEFIRAF